MQRADLILQGAFDVHAHGYPEFTLQMPPRVDNVEWGRLAVSAGMRGFVVKSHVWPTTTAAHMLNALYPELTVLGSIACNPPAGGLNPVSVEMALQAGARIVWMPTWSAWHESQHPNIFRDRMRPYITTLSTDADSAPDLAILDPAGALLSQVHRIVELCGRYGATIATGHLPVAASLVLSEHAARLGVRLILTHPLSGSVGASVEDQRAIADRGGFIEHVFIGCMPMHQRLDPRRIVESIEAVGPEHVVLGSDAIEAWNPPAPEVLRMFIATLLALGVSEDAVHLMTHDNPARAVGLSSPAGEPNG